MRTTPRDAVVRAECQSEQIPQCTGVLRYETLCATMLTTSAAFPSRFIFLYSLDELQDNRERLLVPPTILSLDNTCYTFILSLSHLCPHYFDTTDHFLPASHDAKSRITLTSWGPKLPWVLCCRYVLCPSRSAYFTIILTLHFIKQSSALWRHSHTCQTYSVTCK